MIALGCDHGGFDLMEEVVKYLESKSIDFENFGCFSNEAVDYPQYAKNVCEKVLEENGNIGILICGTGIGMSITANKTSGIRAALVSDTFSAQATREHNDANVLVMGGRVLDTNTALEIVGIFLNTDFSSDERHIRRINQIENI